jgi:hypothetical protein
MNREAWFRVLQVAVVAPWLYHISTKQTHSPYFRVGLKLVAGSIVMLNVKPLMQDYKDAKELIENVAKEMQPRAAANKGTVIEGEAQSV